MYKQNTTEVVKTHTHTHTHLTLASTHIFRWLLEEHTNIDTGLL